MIDPVNPGPAGTQGPAGTVTSPPGPGVIDGVLQYGTAIIQQSVQAALTAIRDALAPAIDTVNATIAKAAAPVAAAINQGETAVQMAAAQAKTAINQQMPGLPPAPTGGGTSEQGVQPGQFIWNVYQYKVTPYPTRMSQTVAIPGVTDMSLWCFRGSWNEFQDAANYGTSVNGNQPPAWCYGPGGPATGGGGPTSGGDCLSGLYHVWQQFLPDGSANCVELCDGVAGPAGFKDMGLSASPGANATPGTVYQCIPPSKGTGGGVQYYAGCVSGKAVAWSSTDQVPSGVTGQVGPFADQGMALAAASCGGTGGTGGTGDTGGGTGTGTGQCCPTEVTKVPSCIYIDLCAPDTVGQAIYLGLCKWTQSDGCFYEPVWRAIKKALCEFVKDPECLCKIQQSDKAIYEDCDGELSTELFPWIGNVGRLLRAGTMDDMAKGGLP